MKQGWLLAVLWSICLAWLGKVLNMSVLPASKHTKPGKDLYLGLSPAKRFMLLMTGAVEL
jgi:hypothetical protein